MRFLNLIFALLAVFFGIETLAQQPTARPKALDNIGSGIALRRLPRQRLYGRDLLEKRMMPESTVEFDFHHSGGAISTFTLSHENATYVNLENLYLHGLIHDVPICGKPDQNNKTFLTIRFTDYSTFRFAKQQWLNSSNLLFVIEDPSCEAGAHERSIYKPSLIEFLEGPGTPISVRITAMYEGVGWHGTSAASHITFSLESVARFQERHAHSFSSVHRVEDLGDCIKHPKSCASSIITDVKELWGPVEELGDGEHEVSWGINANLNREGNQCMVPAEGFQKMRWLPQIAFINTYADLDFDIYFKVSFKTISKDLFDGLGGITPGDKFTSFIAGHLDEGKIGVRANKDIRIGLQAQVTIQAGYEYFCLIVLWPTYEPASCSEAVIFGTVGHTQPAKWDDANFKKAGGPENNGLKSFEKFGLQFIPTAGIAVWARIGTYGDVKFLTPGFDLIIPKDSYAEVGSKNKKVVYENTMNATVAWRAPQIDITESKVYASISIGPRISLSMPMGPTNAISMSARVDMPRLQVTAGKKHNVDENCQSTDTNAMADAMGVWLDASIQPYASLTLPFAGPIIDSDWLGAAIFPEWKGFLWKKTLAGICQEGTMFDPQYWMDILNEKFREITASVKDINVKGQEKDYDEYMPDWKEWKGKHPGDDSPRPSHIPHQPECP